MKPILVLQMQRMGDIILSFPLLIALQKAHAGQPIWTVAEPNFFLELMNFAPTTTFFPPDAGPKLKDIDFHSVINLSHRENATKLAASLKAENYYGARNTTNCNTINGNWALYRASIVHNNRYNLFHWSDLQILDHQNIRPFYHTAPRNIGNNKVGIFVGASEKEKRPSPEFFASLALELYRKHYQPIFLGGPNDVELGNEAMSISGLKNSSLCGKLSLVQLANILQELQLFITPDTGPMHLAAWLKTPVLNISVGPVNPWETGPFSPNNYIIQPNIACSGCWQACKKIPCQQKLHAKRVALIAKTIMERPERLTSLEINDMRIYKTSRDERSLYNLLPVNQPTESTRYLLAKFWQDWFWHKLNHGPKPSLSLEHLSRTYPHLKDMLCKAIISLGQELRIHIKNVYRGEAFRLEDNFWQKLPQTIRPLTSYLHLLLQNNNFSHEAWNEVLQDIESIGNILR